jgi:putative oxidoreductase
MKIVTIIARVLLGLIFVVFGFNGFFHFIHMPPPTNPAAGQFFTAVSTTGYMSFVFLLQIIGGLLVLLGFFVPLGLTILCPIIVNIVLFHFCMGPDGLPLAIVVSLLAIFLIWRHWANFAGLLRQGA